MSPRTPRNPRPRAIGTNAGTPLIHSASANSSVASGPPRHTARRTGGVAVRESHNMCPLNGSGLRMIVVSPRRLLATIGPAPSEIRATQHPAARAVVSDVFAGVPDFRADLVATAVDGDCVCGEWRWHGTHADGSRLDMAGVIMFGVRAERIAWAWLYVEPVEQQGEGIEAAVRDMSGQQ